ncbi:MAG: hypothetical protein M9898_04035 [Chitinophagaceae bacterium]|nr:hypothetical protein [Chitinophagaceae bacterium]
MKYKFTISALVCFFLLFSIRSIGQITSAKDGYWNDGTTWNGGVVPGSGDNVVINHAVVCNSAITRTSGTTTTINAGHSLKMGATYKNDGTTNVYGTFQLDGGGWADGNNDFIYHAGSYLVFNAGYNYNINSGQRFWPGSTGAPDNVVINSGNSANLNDAGKTINNLILWGGFTNNYTNTITINGNLEIHKDGYVSGNSPVYNSGSTLLYASGGTYGLGQEWRASSSPYNVHISNSTELNYPTFQEAKTINGNLTIDAGSSLYMDYGTPSASIGALTVDGDVNVTGNLSLGEFNGDDLKILGNLNFYSGYNFNPNNRAVWFIKPSGTQSITTPSNAALTIPYIVIGTTGSGTTLQLGQNLTIDAPSSGNAIAFTNNNDIIDLNGHNLTIGTSGISNQISGPGSFKGNSSSDLTLLGTGSVGALHFTSGYQQLRNLIIDRTFGSIAATLATPVTLNGTGTSFTNGLLEISNNDLTFNTSSSYTSAGIGSFIVANGSGKVIKNFNAPGSFTYPIGDNTGTAEYSPATINLTSLTGTVPVSINLRNSQHTNNNSPTNYLIRYWSVTASGTYTGNADFIYTDADIAGTESSLIIAGWNGSAWNLYGNANAATNTLSVSSQSNLNRDFTAGDGFSSVATLPDNYFRSQQTGAWNVAGNWQSSPDGISNWVTSTLVPDDQAKGILIQSPHTITINSTISLDHTSVEGTLQLDNGGTMNIYGSGNDLVIQSGGILLVTNTANYTSVVTYQNTNSSVSVASDGKVIIGNGPSTTGTGYEGFATYNKNTWANGSKFIWNNGLAFGTSGFTYFPNSALGTSPIFSVGPTVIPTIASAGTLTINGILDVRTDINFNAATGERNFRDGITGNSTLTIATGGSGTQNITEENAILGGSDLKIVSGKILNLKKSVLVPKDSSVTISGANVNNSTSGNTLTIKGTFDITSQQLTNASGAILLDGTGTFRSSNAGNTSWPLISVPSGTVTLSIGSTIEMYASSDQTFQSRSDFSNLIFSGSGTKTPSSGFDFNGTMTIKGNAIFDAKSYTIGNSLNSNLTMTGGRYRTTSTGENPTILGTYDLTGGTIEYASTNTTPQTIRNGVNYFNIEVTGADSIKNGGGGNVMLKDGGSFTVKNGGKFTININSIKGVNSSSTAQVKVENGGTINVGNTGGFNGRSPATIGDTTSAVHGNISNIILDAGSTINYSRSNPPFTGTGSQPITTGTFTYQNLTLSGTGNKIAPFKSNLQINGDLTVMGNAQFAHDSSTVSFINSADAQNINAAGVTYPPVFYNLTNQNTSTTGLNVNNFISVKSELTLSDNSKINLGDSIRLVSDNDQTASVAPIPEGANAASIAYDTKGAFIVERYIPNHSKAWQLLSVPTTGSTIHAAWQNSQYNINNRGINITGPFADWSARGFDSYSPSPSMKYYNPVNNTFTGIPNTNTELINNHPAYFIFIRGDRRINDPWTPANETTIHTAGKLYAPTPLGAEPPAQTVLADKFALIGNPYASAIDFDQLTFTGSISTSYYIWDPRLTRTTGANAPSVYGLGAYRLITGGVAVPDEGSYVVTPIQSGQAFFVDNPGTTDGSVAFSESAKVSGSASIFRNTRNKLPVDMSIRTNLFITENLDKALMDGTLQQFGKDFQHAVDRYDARKIINSSENISIHNKEYPLTLERKPVPTEGDTTFYVISGMSRRNYSLELTIDGADKENVEVYFNDSYEHSKRLLNEGKTQIDFSVNSDKASSSPNRFYLTFKPAIPPFAFANEKATAAEDHITLTWRGLNQSQVASFTIEHSADGATFANAGLAEVKTGATADYLFTTIAPKSGINYYRVKAVMKDGSILYSHVLAASVHLGAAGMYISPNPVREVIRLHLYRMAKGDYQIQVYTMEGKRVLSRKITHAGGSADFNITPQGMAKGLYQLEIYKPDGSKASQLLMLDK